MSENVLSWATATTSESKFQKNSKNMIAMLKGFRRRGKGPLYSHQVEAVLNIRRRILEDQLDRQHCLMNCWRYKVKPVAILAPTGSGKTGMMVLIPYVLSSKKVLIVTTSKPVSEQIAEAFGHRRDKQSFFEAARMVDKNAKIRKAQLDSLLEDVKIIKCAEDIKERLPGVVIVNAQKFAGRSKMSLTSENGEVLEDLESFFEQFDTLIVDEGHHLPAPTWMNIVKGFRKPVPGLIKKIVTLTGTPYRVDGGKETFFLGSEKKDLKRVAYP